MQFLRPETLPQVINLLAQDPPGTKVIAGGVGLVMLLQQRQLAPKTLVSLARVPGLNQIELAGAGLHIGPMALLREVAESPLVRDRYPALAQACAGVGHVRIRNQATLGGNLAEADYATDPPAALLSLNASLTLTGPAGSRRLPLSDFFLGAYQTVLAPNELITDIFIPHVPPTTRMAYRKYKSHSALERPSVGVAVVAGWDGDRCTELRVAVGAACAVPRRLVQVEALARNQALADDLITEIAEGYAAGLEPIEDVRASAWYRTQMIRVQVRRTLQAVRDGHW